LIRINKKPLKGFYFATKGSNPIILALLMAVTNSLWCFEQAPVFVFGLIFPDLDIYLVRLSVSRKFISSIFLLQK